MARHLVLAMPVPPSRRYQETVEALRAWSPGLRDDGAEVPHIQLARLAAGDLDRLLFRLRAALATHAPLECRVQGLGGDPDVRHARTVFADVESPGLDAVEAAALTCVGTAVGETGPHVASHVTLAHLPAPTDLRSFLRAHEETEFTVGTLDRLAVLEAVPRQGHVAFTEVASVPLAGDLGRVASEPGGVEFACHAVHADGECGSAAGLA